MDRLSLPQEGKYKTYLFFYYLSSHRASHMALVVKNPPTNAGDLRDTGSIPRLRRHPVEGMATHSSILAWRIPWTGEPGGLQFLGSQRVRHD